MKRSTLALGSFLSFLFGSVAVMVLGAWTLLFQLATVKVDSATVYRKMSTNSDVAATLAKGRKVRVTMSILGSEGAWCSVTETDSDTKLVSCNM